MARRRTIPQRRKLLSAASFLGVLGLLGIGFAVSELRPQIGRTPWFFGLIGMGLFMLLVVQVLWSRVFPLRLRAALDQARWQRCLYCFFDLRGLGSQGTCPECGQPFTARDTREQWHRALDSELNLDGDRDGDD